MFITLVIFLLILGLLVFVHELGHFFIAKKMGVRVEEFGFGFPPRVIGVQKCLCTGRRYVIWGRKKPMLEQGTVYSLNLIPLGGFVKIKGEGGEFAEAKDSFANKKVLSRGGILAAGVAMNFILAVALLSVGFGVGLPHALEDAAPQGARLREESVQIVSVLENSPAYRSAFLPGDVIRAVDGQPVVAPEGLQKYLNSKLDETVFLSVERGNEQFVRQVTPEILKETGKPGIGVGLIKTAIVSYPWYLAPWQGLKAAVFFTGEIFSAFYNLLKNLIVRGEVAVDLTGPVGIAVVTGRVARLGFIYLLQFTALLSINLAVINFLPFPALDGGRILFLAIEAIRRRPVSQKIENLIHNLGFALLMLLVVVVTYRDVIHYADRFINLGQKLLQ